MNVLEVSEMQSAIIDVPYRGSIAVRRLFARMVDYMAFVSVIEFVVPNPSWLAIWWCWLVWVLIESVCISMFGTTPGKYLFSLRITSRDEKPLSFQKALSRSFRVWLFGLAGGVPLVSLVTMGFAFARFKEKGITVWDERTGTLFVHERIVPLRIALGVLIVVALALGSLGR